MSRLKVWVGGVLLALALALTSVLTTVPLAGQTASSWLADFERFQLFTGCEGLGLDVYVQGDEADSINLTDERVRTMAESRLRAARLYDAFQGYPALSVSILTLDDGPAFVIQVRMAKMVRDATTGMELGTNTWGTLSFGTHGDDAGFIMQGLSEKLDEFILEYLRVNEASCS